MLHVGQTARASVPKLGRFSQRLVVSVPILQQDYNRTCGKTTMTFVCSLILDAGLIQGTPNDILAHQSHHPEPTNTPSPTPNPNPQP